MSESKNLASILYQNLHGGGYRETGNPFSIKLKNRFFPII
jgi:hypothetical protein